MAPTLTRSRSTTRRPAVSGYFYPEDRTVLHDSIGRLWPSASAAPAHGVVLPHSSLRRCGEVLSTTLAQIQVPSRCIIIGPSHTGSAMRWSLMTEGAYQTPLGIVPIDASLSAALAEACPFLAPDPWNQRGEHSIEALLPFLQFARPHDLSIVPIVYTSDAAEEFKQLAHAVVDVLRSRDHEPVLLIASSDLSYFESTETGKEKDRQILERLQEMDPDGLIQLVHRGEAAMCGYGAAACVLDATAQLGTRQPRVASYTTSAQAGGDPHSVTGYAGVILS